MNELNQVIYDEDLGIRGKPFELSDSTTRKIRKKINSSKLVALFSAYLFFVVNPVVTTDTLAPLYGKNLPTTREIIKYKSHDFEEFLGKCFFLAGAPVREFVNYTRDKLEDNLK